MTRQRSLRKSGSATFRADGIPGFAGHGTVTVFTRMACGRRLPSRRHWAPLRHGRRPQARSRKPRSKPMSQAKPTSENAAGSVMTEPAALYFGDVMHARLKPFGHRFNYRVMSLLIDLD